MSNSARRETILPHLASEVQIPDISEDVNVGIFHMGSSGVKTLIFEEFTLARFVHVANSGKDSCHDSFRSFET